MRLRIEFDRQLYGYDDIEGQLGACWSKRIWEAVVTNTIVVSYPQGLPLAQTRSLARVFKAVDVATVYADIDKPDLMFLQSVFLNQEIAVHPANVRVFCAIQDAIQEALTTT